MPATDGLPITQYWHATEPPAYVAELTGTFKHHNRGRPHTLFDAPAADRFISSHFESREAAAFRACALPALQADYFRYCAIFQLGGIWADAGMICTRNLDPLLAGPWKGRLFRSSAAAELLVNGLMAFSEPRHPFLGITVDFVTELIGQRWKGKVNAVTGFSISALLRLGEADSFDLFLASMDELHGRYENLRLPAYGRLLCEIVGEHRRAVDACRDIHVSPASSSVRWVKGPTDALPHRDAQTHWSRMGSSIYARDG